MYVNGFFVLINLFCNQLAKYAFFFGCGYNRKTIFETEELRHFNANKINYTFFMDDNYLALSSK